jgi:hypothetical protein
MTATENMAFDNQPADDIRHLLAGSLAGHWGVVSLDGMDAE